jgi:hypothetical protein
MLQNYASEEINFEKLQITFSIALMFSEKSYLKLEAHLSHETSNLNLTWMSYRQNNSLVRFF